MKRRTRDFSKKTSAGKPLYQTQEAKRAKVIEQRERVKVTAAPSWWVLGAAPETPREVFTNMAQSRNDEMRTDPRWQLVDKLSQIGQS